MHADDTTPKPARPTPRRTAWGTLLADAPWDGRPRAAAPVLVPATAAGRAASPDLGVPGPGLTPRGPKRVPFGRLLAGTPWAVRPPAAAPVAATEPGRLVVTA